MARETQWPVGSSKIAISNRSMRHQMFAGCGGKCFYCGIPVTERGCRHDRDWLLTDIEGSGMVREHCIPSSRGGDSSAGNTVPACGRCNRNKGQFTLEEYRFLRGLRTRSFPYRFAAELPSEINRDWLICSSATFERSLLLRNMPAAKDGVPRVRPMTFGRG